MKTAFHARGLADLLKDPPFRDDIQKRHDELVRERAEELKTADAAEMEEILDQIEEQVKREFAKHYCLF
jgi:hypothetical protein